MSKIIDQLNQLFKEDATPHERKKLGTKGMFGGNVDKIQIKGMNKNLKLNPELKKMLFSKIKELDKKRIMKIKMKKKK